MHNLILCRKCFYHFKKAIKLNLIRIAQNFCIYTKGIWLTWRIKLSLQFSWVQVSYYFPIIFFLIQPAATWET